ncbi:MULTISPECIES: hypothetical protein [unclassified Lentimicrobium]|uniref:hypothetical protein n=1 Tax=unclassified Lentimicrobium TaxID=2677434 RepID=UPI0015553CFF|nr:MULTISPECIES: hypothetical protein [unclassified Lentimicrobium]NPD45184.1 hypothetical protein [Lentimicrobium sp. S6]NPD84483.1 hypothetical protein [Lentimicrobium sp. L6]
MFGSSISISYPNLDSPSILNAYITERNNFDELIDTLTLGVLNEQNSYTIFIDFKENSPNYLLLIESTLKYDTLYDINYNRKSNCKENIKDFKYRLNGELMTTKQLSIH